MLSPDQLEEWARYFDEEPWGFSIEETRFVKLMAVLGAKDLDLVKHRKTEAGPPIPPDIKDIQRLFGLHARHVDESSPPSTVQ